MKYGLARDASVVPLVPFYPVNLKREFHMVSRIETRQRKFFTRGLVPILKYDRLILEISD